MLWYLNIKFNSHSFSLSIDSPPPHHPPTLRNQDFGSAHEQNIELKVIIKMLVLEKLFYWEIDLFPDELI